MSELQAQIIFHPEREKRFELCVGEYVDDSRTFHKDWPMSDEELRKLHQSLERILKVARDKGAPVV